MSDINNILSKHFAGEATPNEEVLAQQFKRKNPEEYKALQAFWAPQKSDLAKFDTSEGWKAVTKKTTAPKRVLMYTYLRRAASIAAVFLLAIVGVYMFSNQNVSSELITVIAKAQNEKVALADGSIVYLNKDATLSYPEVFNSNKRELTLNGEAFFEVAKDATRPFIVHTTHSDVAVLGTSFNVHAESNQTEVSVTTGKVKVQSLNREESTILIPNQSATVNEEGLDTYPTSNKNYMAWKTGVFYFEKTTLNDVVSDLNSYYSPKIILENLDTDCQFSSTFQQKELTEIIEIIQLSCGLQLRQKNGNYELY